MLARLSVALVLPLWGLSGAAGAQTDRHAAMAELFSVWRQGPGALITCPLPVGRTEVGVTHQVSLTGLTGADAGLGEGFLVDRQARLRLRWDFAACARYTV